MSNEVLDKKMRQIEALLTKADHPNTPPAEADAARAMADRLMNKYRVEEEDLRARGALNAETITPGSKVVIVCPAESPYYNTYWTLMCYVAQHCGVRLVSKWGVDPESGVFVLGATLVGFEMDIRFAEMLYQSARLTFADRMEPKVDTRLSDEDNVYRLRSAGIERIKIAKMMGYGDTTSATAKVTNMYKRACKARGEDPALTGRGTSVTAFRESYTNGFCSELWSRLHRARNAASTDGTALVLHNRKDAVDEAFYSLFPSQRPGTDVTPSKKSRRRSAWTAADQRRYDRANSAGGRAGSNAGRAAAREVDLGPGGKGKLSE